MGVQKQVNLSIKIIRMKTLYGLKMTKKESIFKDFGALEVSPSKQPFRMIEWNSKQ
jgi:hypothetical protein